MCVKFKHDTHLTERKKCDEDNSFFCEIYDGKETHLLDVEQY